MIDKKKLEKIRLDKQKRELERIELQKQMEIDSLNEQLETMKKRLMEKDKEIKTLKKSKK